MRNSATKLPSPGRPRRPWPGPSPKPPNRGSQRPEPAHAQVPRAEPLLEHADDDEQAAGAERVADDLEDHPLQRQLVPGEHPQQDEAHVADARVGDHPLEVGLREGHQRAVEDPGHAQAHRDVAEWKDACGNSGNRKRSNP